MNNLPQQLCAAGKLMFEKRLTDLAGGNISVRDGDTVYMSPRFIGQRKHWQMEPSDVVSGRWADDEITNDPRFSREGWSHLLIYRKFPEAQAVIHAHPFHVMPFVAACKPIEPVLEGTQKFGTIGFVKATPGHTRELGEEIVVGLNGLEKKMLVQAACVLIPYHGIILVSKELALALDALERIDVNAYCLIARKAIGG